MSSLNEEDSVKEILNSPQKKLCRREYNVSNLSCEIVVNGLRKISKKFEKSCKAVIHVVKADRRTKFKTHFCLTAATEFMERVHSLDFSNRIIFLNGTGNTSRYNCSVFTLMIDSHVGALPFGFFITSYSGTSLLETSFNALSDIAPTNAFNTPPFPKVIITGFDSAEYAAVTKCFPPVRAFIGTFHLLRDVWGFLWNPINDIALNDKSHLFKLFKDIVLSPDEEMLSSNVCICEENSVTKKYPEFSKYLTRLLKKKDLWGLDFRVRKYISYSKNILASEMHVLKENIFFNCRDCGVPELFEFFCSDYSDYYKNKIEDAIKGSLKRLYDTRFMPPCDLEFGNFTVGSMCCDEILVISTKNNSSFYVNKELNVCTCVLGKCGMPCIHQSLVATKLNSELLTIAPLNDEEKLKYYYLATGSTSTEQLSSITCDNTHVNESSEDVVHENDSVTEYIVVTPDDFEKDRTKDCAENHSVDDCVRAVENFWSKLSPFANEYPNEVYRWLSKINQKLDEANSVDDVFTILNQELND